MSFFESLIQLPEDAILGLPKIFKADTHPQKANLGIGAYQDSEGKPFILSTVRDTELALIKKEHSKDYLPIDGHPEFIKESLQLIFGEQCAKLKEGSIFGAQALGGTGALRLGGEFLAQSTCRTIFLSEPSWPNHRPIFLRSGMNIESYRYYDEQNHRVDFAALCATVKTMPPASIIILQPCCHNPTATDLSFSQWQELAELIKKHTIFPFFDFAYQGFGKDLDEDAKPIRYFVEQGHEMIVAQSFSKNFGLYGERVGLVAVVTGNPESAQKVGSHIKQIIRGSYSNPPRFGAQIVAAILQNPELKKAWQHELQAMHDRIVEMRDALSFGLQSKSLHRDYSFLNKQKGIFAYTGLNKKQVIRLREEKGVYMVENGRMSLAGLNTQNLDYVIDSILEVS